LTAFPAPPPAQPAPPESGKPGLPLILGETRPLGKVAPADDPGARVREYLVHALLNHNDFITIR